MVRPTPADAFSDDGAKKATQKEEKSIPTGHSVTSVAVIISVATITVATAAILVISVTVATGETGTVNDRRGIMLGVGIPLIVISNIFSAFALYFLLKPINQLSHWMKSKTFNPLELGNFASSRIREVQSIFDSFETVRDKLDKVKKFIPAAMLAQIESDSDDENFDDKDDDDEGEVKSVFGRTTESADHQNIQSTRHASRVESVSLIKSTMTNPLSNSGVDGHTTHTTKQDSTTKQSTLHRTRSASHVGARMTKELLVSRSVSIVAFNLRDFHFSTQHADEGSLEQNYGVLLDQFQLIAKEHRGILDSFHGDRFHFTFNAVKPCHSHPTMATTAALKIAQHMASQSSHHSAIGSRVTCGVATGRCLVGNLGNERSKRFSVIGAPYTQATVLERLCKRYFNTSVLLSAETAVECETHIAFMFMGLIDSPGGRNHPIAAAKYVKSSKSEMADEWMYEVQDQDANCDYHTGNMAFRALLRGDIPLAEKYLQNFNMKYVEAAEIKRLLESFIKHGLKPTDLGSYYNECIMSN